MGIAIALAIAEGIAIAVGIAKVGRHLLTLGVTHAAQGLEDTGRAVAFVGAGQIERSLRQRVKTFRQADAFAAAQASTTTTAWGSAKPTSSGGDQHAAKDAARIFSGFDHPGQPEQGSVGVRTAQRFDEGTDRSKCASPCLSYSTASLN